MKPGRELDALIAEKVMGWKNVSYSDETGVPPDKQNMKYYPQYSTDIAAAWEVVEKLFQDGWSIHIDGSETITDSIGGFDVKFTCRSGARGRFKAEANTLPHAICLAVLKAVGIAK